MDGTRDFFHTGLNVSRSELAGMQANYMLGPGTPHFVDASIAASGNGLSWREAKKTIEEAVAIATTRNDTIFIAPGDYDAGAVINITTQGLKLIAASWANQYQNKAMLMDGSSVGYHLMTVNAHEVVIDGLAFSAAANTYDALQIAPASASYKVLVQNCRFDGWSGEYGIKANSAFDSPDLVIRNNLFRSWNTAGVQVNATRCQVLNNVFHVVTDKIGLEHIPVGGSRPDNRYNFNTFLGAANASTTGIKFTGAPSNGMIEVIENRFQGTFDTSITTIAAIAGNRNFLADNTGGNSLIDVTT